MELKRYYNMVRRWIWLLTIATLIASVTSYWVSSQIPPTYRALARLVIGPGIDSPNPDRNALLAGGQLIQTYTELATTRPMLQAINDELNLGISVSQLDSMVRVTSVPETQILSIRVRDDDPARAAAVANTLAELLVRQSPSDATGPNAAFREEMRLESAKLQATIKATEAEIKKLEADFQATPILDKQRLILDLITEQRNRLADSQRSLTTLYQLLGQSVTNQVKIIEPATVDPAPEASPVLNNVLLAAAAGFVLALVMVLVFEYFDDTVKSADELAQVTGVPFLGAIARHKTLHGSGAARLAVQVLTDSRAAENYRMLGTKLLYANHGRTLRSVLVSSAQVSDAIGEVAANVAVTLAQTGSKVVLVDANLRRPSIGEMFGVEDQGGLTDVLSGQVRQPELTTIDWVPSLSVLSSGSTTANPFELLGSPRMLSLIEQLEGQADIIVIAGSPLLSFADSLVLASRVDGVMIVARSGKTRRNVVSDAVESLRSVGATIIGTVLNNSRHGTARYIPSQPLAPIAAGDAAVARQIEDIEKKKLSAA